MRRDDDMAVGSGALSGTGFPGAVLHDQVRPVGGGAPGAGEEPKGLDDQLCFALYAATNAIIRAYRPLLRAVGLTYPQYVVLMALWEDDEASPSDLGARVRMAPDDLTPVVDGLVDAELVERHRHRLNRRVVRIGLTDRGRLMEERSIVAQHEVRCQTKLSTDALEQLRGSLHDLTANLDDEVRPGTMDG